MGIFCKGSWIVILAAAMGSAWAAPGDAEAVAKAKADYEAALKGGNVGVVNAMKNALEFQLSEAKKKGTPLGNDADKSKPHDPKAGADAGSKSAANG